MNFLLIYKGRYQSSLTAPEARNIGLSGALLTSGHSVVLAGKDADPAVLPEGCGFVSLYNFRRLVKEVLSADVILLHGGGPLLLLLCCLSVFLGKRLVLDAYAPRWIELDFCSERSGAVFNRIAAIALAYFNVFRNLVGAFLFDLVVVANKRQQDLIRGFQAPFFLTRNFKNIQVIGFGCEKRKLKNRGEGLARLKRISGGKIDEQHFVVGWLGGLYEWFNIDSLLKALALALHQEENVRIVFFGVSADKEKSITCALPNQIRSKLVFLPWIDYKQRLDYWEGLDLALVWGGDNAENDYASRTRNFDCMSIGLPVLQNYDDEWGERIKKNGAGCVTTLSLISHDLLTLANDCKVLATMSEAMYRLSADFYWSVFSEKLIAGLGGNKTGYFSKMLVFILLLILMPVLILFASVSCFKEVFASVQGSNSEQ